MELIEANRFIGEQNSRLKELSYKDHLTGLVNRRSLEETLRFLIKDHGRSGDPFALVLIDLDYFKRIND